MATDKNHIEYDGFPFISNITKYVQNEVANRSVERIREDNTPYIRITPGFTPDGTEHSKIVLKGIEAPTFKNPAEYDFKDLYRPDMFFRPLAGVTSLDITYLNA